MLNDPAEGFRSKLEQHRPTIVVVYEDNFNFLSKMCLTRMREVAYDILDASRKAGAVAIVNGSDTSDQALDYPQRGFRCVLIGEAEWTLVEVSAELAEQRECSI
jgi:anaerobic magnesium-protoporphyrin IX monomethyl ester cyclase